MYIYHRSFFEILVCGKKGLKMVFRREGISKENIFGIFTYCKVASRSMSRLVAHPSFFRMSMKWKFDVYVL